MSRPKPEFGTAQFAMIGLSYRAANLPANLTQAQRDFFGAHTYERVDKPDQGAVHTDRKSLAK